MEKSGKVYLIGAGPGDPGLLTIKGKEILEQADVIVYDYLVNPTLLKYTHDGSEIIYVGKKAGSKEMSQRRINSLLVRKAKSGSLVARLKGGDPLTFGRGGEEAEELVKNSVPFEIVPGVSSVSAVPGYAGISLTHRDFTSSFAVVTGHEDPKKETSNIPWTALSQIGTIVFLMGVSKLKQNMKTLIDSGKDQDTPAAIITWGTYPNQKTLTGTIGNIADKAKKNKDITSPGIVVVGEVVKLREIINWYEHKPLFGKTIVVTRPKKQAAELIHLLEEQGAKVIAFPTIEITSPTSYKSLDKAINNSRSYDWIIFTSVNGVRSFFARFNELNKDIRELYGIRIAAIGQITAEDIEKMGLKVEIVPDDFTAEGLVKVFKKQNIGGSKILIPRAKVARDILPETLKNMGAHVDVVTAYVTKNPPLKDIRDLKRLLDRGKIDVLTFTSSSTAKNFFELFPNFKNKAPLIACIGPITAKTVKDIGYKTKIMPKKYTVPDLSDEILAHFTKR